MRVRTAVFGVFLGVCFALPGVTDDIDDLFQSPPTDLVDPAPSAPPPSPVDPVRPFARLNTWAAATTDLTTSSLYYETGLTGGLDFRPDETLRLMVSAATALPNGTALAFSPPAITEFFIDYSPVDQLSLRMGQFGLTWGQARLVTNAGNLVSAAASGVTVKTSLASPFGDLVFVASAQGPLDEHKTPAKVLYAGSWEHSWGPLTLGLSASQSSARAQDPVWNGAAFARTSWGGADWYLESAATWLTSPTPRKAIGTLGSLWQGGYPVWSVNAEYQFEREDDDRDNDLQTSVVAVSVDTKKLWSVTPKVLWSQDWEDRSGQLTPALVLEPAPHLTLTAAVPWVYGVPGSRFVASTPDPEGRWWALGLKASLAWNY